MIFLLFLRVKSNSLFWSHNLILTTVFPSLGIIFEIKFNHINDLKKLKKLDKNNGETEVKVVVDKNNQIHIFYLKSKRKINNQLLNTLNLAENVLIE